MNTIKEYLQKFTYKKDYINLYKNTIKKGIKMLEVYEQNSLKLIFDKIAPDKVADTLKVLIESLTKQENHQFSDGIIKILDKAVKNIDELKKKAS